MEYYDQYKFIVAYDDGQGSLNLEETCPTRQVKKGSKVGNEFDDLINTLEKEYLDDLEVEDKSRWNFEYIYKGVERISS